MFIVTDCRFREVARTDSVSEAMRLKAELNSKPCYRALKPFGVSYLPERVHLSAQILIFPPRR